MAIREPRLYMMANEVRLKVEREMKDCFSSPPSFY
jgi:hypothetical protein